jgi:hypothetical protein
LPRFVLDHNFPLMSTGIKWPPSISLEPLSRYDARLTENHTDWQVLRELDRRGDADGYIRERQAIEAWPGLPPQR